MFTTPLMVRVCAMLRVLDEAPRGEGGAVHITLPEGDVFAALLADPKQPHSYASVLSAKSEEHSRLVAAVAFGDNIGLVRWTGAARGDWIQIGIAGAIFAQFDLLEANPPRLRDRPPRRVKPDRRQRRSSGPVPEPQGRHCGME